MLDSNSQNIDFAMLLRPTASLLPRYLVSSDFPKTSYLDVKVYLTALIRSKPQDMVQLFPISRYVSVTKDLIHSNCNKLSA